MHRTIACVKTLALAAVLGIALCGSATAANVALFADTTYIDYTPPSTGSEGYNMQVALASFGNVVTTFTGVTAAEWSAALAGKQILVVPEQENGEIAPDLPPATITVIQNFVNGGGTLIIASDYSTTLFLNAVFGDTIVLDGTGTSSTLTGAASGTVFAGGPATLPDNNATDGGVDTSSLPAGGTCAYDAGTQCMVFQINQGSGKIFSLAWDFFDEAPNGSQDGGWNAVLRAAAGGGAASPGTPIPAVPPSGLVLLGLLLAGFAVMMRRRPTR